MTHSHTMTWQRRYRSFLRVFLWGSSFFITILEQTGTATNITAYPMASRPMNETAAVNHTLPRALLRSLGM